MSESYFERRQLIAQGLASPEGKKAPGKKKIEPVEGIITLDEWFREGDRLATGKCKHCGGKSCKGDPLYFKHSQAHILPKRLFPSVMVHEANRIELCFWNNNCHGNFDSGMLDLMQLACFDEVIEKFIKMYPAIAPKERRNIPDVLSQYVATS